jgi:hypothetical protein
MGKKNKKSYVFEDEFKELGKMAPGIKALLNMTRDIADGYRKYRKKGGLAIPGLEKHLAVKKCECVPDPEPATAPEEITAEPVKAKACAPPATAKKKNRKPAANQSNVAAAKTVSEAATTDEL